MKTLLELVSEMERLGDREAVLYYDGYRTYRWSYRELLRHIGGASQFIESRGLGKGDRLLLWGENRPEWIAVFWACVLRGVTVVPLDFRSSPAFVTRVARQVGPRLLVHGASVMKEAIDLPKLALADVLERAEPIAPIEVAPSDVVQVLYTSGTTGEPKGIVHRHRHLVPTLEPIRREIAKYARYARPFQPIRFLDLLPLSHVFGQFAGVFIPIAMGGAVAFMKEIHPAAIIGMVRRERISVLISVPRFVSSLRYELERRFPRTGDAPEGPEGLLGGLVRWWRHRDVHSALGWKFWAILAGGAQLSSREEAFWFRLGLVVVQGYGLTETTSLVSTNHPLHPRRGSLGKVVGSQEVRLAPDGEILVRGDNVSFEHFGRGDNIPASEWLATGDLGELAPDGTIFYKGRKKEVIVGEDGMNIYPLDVEAALNLEPGVREAIVVGEKTERGERVHAVLLLDVNIDPGAVVEHANRALEPHQRVRAWTVWTGEDFPRAPSTFKVRRHEVLAAIESLAQQGDTRPGGPTSSRSILARRLGRSPEELRAEQKLSDELGLTSLDRIELLAEIEDYYGTELSESRMAEIETVEELEGLVASRTRHQERELPSALSGVVRIGRAAPIRLVRSLFRETVMLPLFRHYIPLTVEGSPEAATPPVLFAPNHTSNLDTIALLAALPRPWRDHLAPAVSQAYFGPYLDRTGALPTRISLGLQFWLAVLAVNAFPLPQSSRGIRGAMTHAGKLVDRGHSILIFPEGRRSPDGKRQPFRAGVGMLAVRLRVPVVPVHIDGLYEVLSVHDSWPTPGPAVVRFGAPLRFHEDDDYREVARTIEREVGRLVR